MEKCFVIQPFDNDKFDKRFVDIFQPAIKKANLDPYRIDKDLSVRVPIDDIEKGISDCAMCFAEITTDNPNVWYELGYAMACQKDVVMVCSEERTGKFPFDIQHRQILRYMTGSTSDYEKLAEMVTKKIQALQQQSEQVKTLKTTPVVETKGLKGHEIAFLILVMENCYSSQDSVPIYSLRSEMEKSGYTDIATSIAIRALSRGGMVETFTANDENYHDSEYVACRLTEIGENWMLENQDQFQFRKINDNARKVDDIPF